MGGVVIVGNGVAGIEAALLLREREPTLPVTLVSEESEHFFSRTALMWVLSGQLSHRCIEPHDRELYARLGFTRVRGRATGLDLARRQLRLAGRAPLDFDRLLLACGSRPRPAPWAGASLAGVGHFVTLQDLEWLEGELWGGPARSGRPSHPEAHLPFSAPDSPYLPRPSRFAARGGPPRAPVVIGGGLIGIEAAEVMAAMKLRPRFFVREEHFWPLALDATESAWIVERMRAHDIDVRLGETVEELIGSGAISHLRTRRATEPCDLCVVATGVVPNTAWLADSGLALERRSGGVIVDEAQQTTDPHVFAAGDCAAVRWPDGDLRPQPLWYAARDQGRTAARAMLGDAVSRARGIFYNSAKLMDVEYTCAGLVDLAVDGEESWAFEERGAVRSTLRIGVVGGRVIGFCALGRRYRHEVWCRWIEERRSLEYVLDHLAESAFDTELVPPLRLPADARARPLTRPAPPWGVASRA
jgi:NADPH-dependent 2,4-dienoyl-CoA reductase/sulfur reductase-like enzyme